jgi:hypothetical protein
MSETLILAAIIAPLVLVPAIILSLQHATDLICRLDGELSLEFDAVGVDFEPSPLVEFERVVRDEIVRLFAIPAPAPEPSPAETTVRRFEVMAAITVFALPEGDEA